MQDWEDIRRWRKERRAALIARRQAISQSERQRLNSLILKLVEQRFFETLKSALVGFYWPIKGEIGPHALIRRLIEHGARAALPVVVDKDRPLEFWAWHPGEPLDRGVWNIPIPAERRVVQPTALLAPLVGFDGAGYRLGYGGGFYDRTLEAVAQKPLTIGLGYEIGRLPTIYPQAHDIQMDAVVTEQGIFPSPPRRPTFDEDPHGEGSYVSPPCFMHELDPSFVGLQPGDETASEAVGEGGGPAKPSRKTCDR
ncbi:MAG: 5-formyltetrahydrofolate cyclo-ligase [Alphaproteobacteria bacterium]